MAAFNNIFPGFAWQQTFRFPAGVFADGESLRANVRQNMAGAPLFSVIEGDGVVRAGNDFTISFTAEQTTGLAPGKVYFDLIADGAVDRHLGLRVHVPVTRPI